MFVFRVSKQINIWLINAFDQSKIRYMLIWFPAYQLVSGVGFALIAFTFAAAISAFYLWPLALVLTYVLGIPIFATWHHSVLLFAMGYLSFFARIGVPFTSWAVSELEGTLNWFRAKTGK